MSQKTGNTDDFMEYIIKLIDKGRTIININGISGINRDNCVLRLTDELFRRKNLTFKYCLRRSDFEEAFLLNHENIVIMNDMDVNWKFAFRSTIHEKSKLKIILVESNHPIRPVNPEAALKMVYVYVAKDLTYIVKTVYGVIQEEFDSQYRERCNSEIIFDAFDIDKSNPSWKNYLEECKNLQDSIVKDSITELSFLRSCPRCGRRRQLFWSNESNGWFCKDCKK